MRLDVENMNGDARLKDSNSTFFNNPLLYAMQSFAFYMCFKCAKPYFGGRRCVRSGYVHRRTCIYVYMYKRTPHTCIHLHIYMRTILTGIASRMLRRAGRRRNMYVSTAQTCRAACVTTASTRSILSSSAGIYLDMSRYTWFCLDMSMSMSILCIGSTTFYIHRLYCYDSLLVF